MLSTWHSGREGAGSLVWSRWEQVPCLGKVIREAHTNEGKARSKQVDLIHFLFFKYKYMMWGEALFSVAPMLDTTKEPHRVKQKN